MNKNTKNVNITKVLFIVNCQKDVGMVVANKTKNLLDDLGVSLFLPNYVDADNVEIGFSAHDLPSLKQQLENTPEAELPQMAMIFGGDGTLIHAARLLAPFKIGVLGVNLGRLGFLTAVEPDQLEIVLPEIISGKYHSEEKMQLKGKLIRNGQVIVEYWAQNDIVVSNVEVSRMIGLDISINGKKANGINGDGLILATPTGSTAYSLSAGGPIVLPESEVFVITPVAAHGLYSRSMVVPANSEVEISCTRVRSTASIAFDGQSAFEVLADDQIIITKHEYEATFIWPEDGAFLNNLNQKLRV